MLGSQQSELGGELEEQACFVMNHVFRVQCWHRDTESLCVNKPTTVGASLPVSSANYKRGESKPGLIIMHQQLSMPVLLLGWSILLTQSHSPLHGLLEVYSLFPFWHARTAKKGIQKMPYSESNFEQIYLLLLKLGLADLPDWTRYGDTHHCILCSRFLKLS